MLNNTKCLGLSGLARCGKDSFYLIAKSELKKIGYNAVKLSFAEALRWDVHKFLLEKTGIDAFTEENSEKELIRDFLVAYGTRLMRRIDKDCWIKKLKTSALEIQSRGDVPVFTDIRYENELDWVKNDLMGQVVHISRVNNKPPNKEEEKNDPILSLMADFNFEWRDFKDGEPSKEDVYSVKEVIYSSFCVNSIKGWSKEKAMR